MIIPVRSEVDIAAARRAAREMASAISMDKYQITEIETSTSELATNLIRHAGGGNIIIERVEKDDLAGIRIESKDEGPGIRDIDLAMREGYSTGGTMGSGLPGVKRMMDEFNIESQPGQGLRVTAIKWLSKRWT